ncbi:TonB-dependent receptor plug domain-containing protein [Pseudemcibacter aquimaris]|uniref:TonB-dependent receptor plug domain-containing protein n=1 Tax=Pseudemcibacter aquimaris TaxID=2857064 RepID=UPI002011CBEB|nr:TonB-dependent receptor [Pseudemcibacter aquimaris]MCC3859815.1 outer membrane beta-barrel protein [Pseudemcibacter aquimaris]WDU60209.1 outer membrane beta-barrel protein [Pseudemcibacter aquimaris]
MGTKSLHKLIMMPILSCGLMTTTMLTPVYAASGGDGGDGGEEALIDASIVTYKADFFEQYAPVSLRDMLQRIPGVQEILNRRRNRNQRGFGNGGDQVLIDGKRLAGKANNINDTLSRISADQVVQIDLIRGAASGLDVQSQGLVINVILAEGASKSSTFWRVMGEYTVGYKVLPQFLVSHTGETGNLNYSVSLERTNDNGYRPMSEIFYDEFDVETGTQEIDHVFGRRGWTATTNLGYDFEDGSELRLNGLFNPNQFFYTEERIELGDDPDNKFWERDSDNDRWEIGGDFTTSLGFLGRSKTLFVVNRNTEDTEVFRDRRQDDPHYRYSEEYTDLYRSEKILRSSITPTIADGQTIEIGGEMAINDFDKIFSSFSRDEAGDALEQKTVSDVEIQEQRYEVFAIHSYNITPEIVMQSSLTTEFSNIVADNKLVGGGIDTRDTSLTYFKPRVNVRYDYTDRDQIRLTVEKKVSQLRFDTFVTSYDAQNDEIRYGNTDLLPTQTWEFEIGYEHRIPNDAGTIEAKAYYHHRIDHQTRVDFTEYRDAIGGNLITVDQFFALPPSTALRDETDFTPAQGNIDSAYIYGADFKGNMRLGFIGVPEATLTLGYRYERRRSMDQFLQQMRNFARHSDHAYTVNYRHDVTKLRFAYGFEFFLRSDWANYDMRYYQPQSPSAWGKAFAEYILDNGIKARVDILELSGSQGSQTTYRYSDHIRFDEIYAREEREKDKPRAIQFSLQGSF